MGFEFCCQKSLKTRVIQLYHDNPTQGHLGIGRTAKKVAERFHIKSLKDKVAEVLNQCLPCQQRKHQKEHHINLSSRPSTKPWSTVAADFCGPYNTGEGFRYILVIVDHFTKWVELIPTYTQETREVAQAFYDRIICRQGCPRRFLTDQGSSFKSNLVEALCSLFQINKIYSSTYYPQGDGIAERFMRSLNNSLSILSRHHPYDWNKYVQGIAFAYNTSVHASTGETPFKLNTGRVPSFPEEGWIKDWNANDDLMIHSRQDYKEYLQSLFETITHAQGHARQGLEASWLRMSRKYKPDTKIIKSGDKVLVRLTEAERNKFPIRKLAPHWSVPATVCEVLSNGKTYRILRDGQLITVNRERMMQLPPQTRLTGFRCEDDESQAEEEKESTYEAESEGDEDYWTIRLSSSDEPSAIVTDQSVQSRGATPEVSRPSSNSRSVEVDITESSSAGSDESGSPVFLGSSTIESIANTRASSSLSAESRKATTPTTQSSGDIPFAEEIRRSRDLQR